MHHHPVPELDMCALWGVTIQFRDWLGVRRAASSSGTGQVCTGRSRDPHHSRGQKHQEPWAGFGHLAFEAWAGGEAVTMRGRESCHERGHESGCDNGRESGHDSGRGSDHESGR